MRFVLQLSYNGTRYHGWQVQQNAHTVQAEVNKALEILLGTPTDTLGCGRTDTGVHAKQFFAQFDADGLPARMAHRLNQLLPQDIAIQHCYKVADDFNVRFDASYRLYEYYVHTLRDPFLTQWSYYRFGPLNFEAMNSAAQLLFEHESFESFSKSNTQVATYRCKIMQAGWKQADEHRWVFVIKADRFLRNMVRAIVGTLLEVGSGRMTMQEFEEVIKSKSRTEAGQSVPAHALYLAQVGYDMLTNWEKTDE